MVGAGSLFAAALGEAADDPWSESESPASGADGEAAPAVAAATAAAAQTSKMAAVRPEAAMVPPSSSSANSRGNAATSPAPGSAASSTGRRHWADGPTTLQGCVINTLCRYTSDLICLPRDVLDALPPHAKACVLAAARRRDLLQHPCTTGRPRQPPAAGGPAVTNALLDALADEGWTRLDVSCCVRLSDRAISAALRRLTNLTALDVSGLSQLSADTLKALPACCPRLATLRLGGTDAADAAALDALPALLPRVSAKEREQLVADSWEDELRQDSGQEGEGVGSSSSSSSSSSNRRLSALKHIVWRRPAVPPAALRMVLRTCPRLVVVSAGGGIEAPLNGKAVAKLPPEALPDVPLDEPLHRCVGVVVSSSSSGHEDDEDLNSQGTGLGYGHARRLPSASGQQVSLEELHIAERFRLAYVSHEAVRQERLRREAAALEKRRLASSSALQVLEQWLDSDT